MFIFFIKRSLCCLLLGVRGYFLDLINTDVINKNVKYVVGIKNIDKNYLQVES